MPHPVVEQGPTPEGYQRCCACNTDIPSRRWVSHKCGFGPKRARAHTELPTPVTDGCTAAVVASEDHHEIQDAVDEVGGSSAGGTAQPQPQPLCSLRRSTPTGNQAPQLQPSSPPQLQPSSSPQLQPSSSAQLQPSSSQQLQPSSSQEQLQEQGLRLEAALLASVRGERPSRHDLAFLETIIQRGLSAPAVSELMRTVQRVRADTLHATCYHLPPVVPPAVPPVVPPITLTLTLTPPPPPPAP